jgi:dipeptidyl aminopeptidase/acylaminoacyl peptidase
MATMRHAAHLALTAVALLIAASTLDAQGARDTTRAGARTTRRPPPPPPDYSAPADAPYTAENVTITTPMGHTMAGTLTIPRGAGRDNPVPAIVTSTGSGPQDRDEFIGIEGYRPFRQIADTLGRRGIAVLRMDDRGTGASTGTHRGSTSADFAEDVRAGLAYLRTRPEIDSRRLGLLGHSEGGMIVPLAALKEPELRGMVLMAPPADAPRSILAFQMRNLATNNPRLTPAQRDSAIARIPGTIDSLQRSDAWMGYFLTYDPPAILRQLKAPVLILMGGTDQQVTPDQAPRLVQAFVEAGNRDVTARVFGNLNHLFIYDPSGFPMGYATLPRRAVEPEVLGAVADWLVARLKP